MNDLHQRQGNAPGPSTGERRSRAERAPAPDALTPADRYQELFVAVQQSRVFEDSKTFVDCAPLGEPVDILAAYRAECGSPDFELSRFVSAHFRSLQPARTEYESVPGQPIREHIRSLWPVLTRHPEAHPPASSLLQLPHPYVVPGGRFGELLMVELAHAQGVAKAIDHLPQLRQEHAWWMRGAEGLQAGQACQRVVRLADGGLLNR